MPSGRSVTAYVACRRRGRSDEECWLNIYVYALSQDRAVSQGLCGNYDGNRYNDLTQAGLSYPSYSREPIEFSKHFMYALFVILLRYIFCCRSRFVRRPNCSLPYVLFRFYKEKRHQLGLC